MTTREKILAIVFGICILIMGGLFIYKEHEHSVQMQAISTQITAQQQLADNITRSLSTYATKDDMTQFAKDANVNLDVIQKNLSTLNSTLSAMNQSTVNSIGQKGNNIPSTSTTPTPAPTNGSTNTGADPYNYQKNIQNLALNETFTDKTAVPIGDVSFDASQQKPWSVNILPREYQSVTTLGTDENEKISAYNNFSINVGGKNYPITITNSKLIQQFPPAKFSWFNPRLFLTTGGGVDIGHLPAVGGSFNVGGTLQIMSYGKSKKNPDISVLQVGAGYQSNKNEFTAIINPVSFNIGSIIPTGGLINNTYVGPSLQVTGSGSVYVGANVSLGF